jgi:WD40 repeat protein
LLQVYKGHEDSIKCCAFSPDGRRVLMGDEGGTVLVWDGASGQVLQRYDRHQWQVLCCGFSPDGMKALARS